MEKKELNGKDLLMSFLYSPGIGNEYNEPIIGRTKLMKMMFLFEKEIYPKFFKEKLEINFPNFEAYYFGPFSGDLADDLKFFLSIGLIISKETNIPLSAGAKAEYNEMMDDNIYDDWYDISFDDESQFELSYELSENGKKYVSDKVWNLFTARQKDILAKFKRQINTISLDTLLDYVYNTYPETAENSLIRDKYIKKESD